MRDSKSLLEGFEFNENEEILVESFSYLSKKTKTTWVAFLTNERFILKQSKVSLTGYGLQDGIGESEFAFIPLNEMQGIKIKKGRIVIDGNIYSNSKSESDFGEFGKGLFGGLSYNSAKEVYELLLASLTESRKEFDFYLWTPDDPQFTTADQTQQKRLDNIVYAELRAVLKICGVLVLLMLGIGLCSRLMNNPKSDDNYSQPEASARDIHNDGWKLFERGDIEGSIKKYDIAIRTGTFDEDPYLYHYYNNRAWAKFKLNDLTGALSDANKSLELNSNYDNAKDTKKSILAKIQQQRVATSYTQPPKGLHCKNLRFSYKPVFSSYTITNDFLLVEDGVAGGRYPTNGVEIPIRHYKVRIRSDHQDVVITATRNLVGEGPFVLSRLTCPAVLPDAIDLFIP